jgi:hypothetical protein
MPCYGRHRDVHDGRYAQHRRWMARKTSEPELQAADSILGSPPRFKEADLTLNLNLNLNLTEHAGICRQYRKRVCPGVEHSAHLGRQILVFGRMKYSYGASGKGPGPSSLVVAIAWSLQRRGDGSNCCNALNQWNRIHYLA